MLTSMLLSLLDEYSYNYSSEHHTLIRQSITSLSDPRLKQFVFDTIKDMHIQR